MGRKRASMAPGDAPDAERSGKKSKKRRREEGLLAGGVAAAGAGGGKRASSSREVVLRRAAEGSAGPILVSFANQTVPEDMGAVEFRMHEADDEEREGEKIVMGDSGRMDYWGLNFGPGAESNDLCRFVVGVEDEGTGELTLHEAGHAYSLRQSVGDKDDNIEDFAMEGLEYKQRKDALVNQFGSKKKKAAIRSRDANVIQAGSVVGGSAMSRVLGQALKEEGGGGAGGVGGASTATDGALAAVEEARRRFLPKMRKEASTPEGVYSAGDIAGAQELESMEREIDRAAEQIEGGMHQWAKDFAERPRESCPRFVGKRLTLLLDLGERNQKRRMLELLYLRHMCVFHHASALLKGTPAQLSAKLDIPEIVLRRLLEKFSVCEKKGAGGVASYVRTKTLKNQLVVHALCLALVLEGCRMEIGVLAEDFRLSTAEARSMLRELGCTATNTSAHLKLPLTFPRSRKARASAK
ncbi:unnamed protein product [Ectocarpus sp. 12 AP-2014]